MPDGFDVDAFMKQRQGAQQSAPAFNVDEFMKGRKSGAEAPKAAPLTARDKQLYGGAALRGLQDPFAQEKAEFERLPLVDRVLQRGGDAVMRGTLGLSKMARQAAGFVRGVARGGTPSDPMFVDSPEWRQREERERQYYEQRRLRRPASLTTDIAEGVIESVPAALAATGGAVLTGGGLPAAMAIGGGMGASGADWQNPKRAALQTAIGAAAPLGGRLAGAAASRLASPAARVATELAAGAGTNVLGTGIEQLAFEGKLDPRALAVSAGTGAALSVPGAARAGRRVPRIGEQFPRIVEDFQGRQPVALDTQPLPPLQGPARPTAPLPENAPTVDLRQPANYEPQLRPPELIAEPYDWADFSIRDATNDVRRNYPGAVGPKTSLAESVALQYGFKQPQAAGGSQPPQTPDIDTPSQPWRRQPQQQALFDAAAKSPWQDSVLAYYRAGLLTNPVGRATDFASTVVNQFADAAVRPVAAAADVIVSKLSGQRSITGPSLSATGKALGSIPQGLRDAGQALKTGENVIESDPGNPYGSEVRSGLGKVADVPINGVFRILGSMDAPFRRFGFTRNLHDRANVAAINESKRGLIGKNQVKARAAELLDRHDIIQAAVRDGERAVLSEPNRISSWLSKQTQNSPNARLAIGIVQPFMRIPLNAVLKGADFAGVGGVKALYKVARGGVRKAQGQSFFRDVEDQRVFAQNVAAGSFGVAGFLLGMELEDQGKLEGYYYTSKRDFPNSHVPTSINIGGENYDVNRLGGFILAPLFIGATYSRLRKQDVGSANALLRSFSGLVQQAPALGYYGAPAKVGRILTADEPGEKIVEEAGGITSGFIPASGAMGAAAKALDQNRKREASGFTAQITSKIPGLRGQLPEKAPALKTAGAFGAKLKEHGIEGDSVKAMKGEPEGLYKARRERIEQWSDKYGNALVNHSGFARLTPDQQKYALKKLQESIHGEANDKEPNLSLFEPERLIYGAKDSEREKAERNKRKFYVEP